MTTYCQRCGEELTAPKFHNGKPYGFSCYEVITGEKPRDKRKFVEAEIFEQLPEKHGSIRLKVSGKIYRLGGCFKDTSGKFHSTLAEFNENNTKAWLVTHDRKGNPIWGSNF